MNPYPLCSSFGLEVSHDHIDYIPWKALDLLPDAVKAHVLDGLTRQTCHIKGPYPWDVEKILARLQ